MSTWIPTLMNMMLDKVLRSMSAKAYPKVPASWGFSVSSRVGLATVRSSIHVRRSNLL